MIKNLLLALAIIHFVPLFFIVWFALFNSINLGQGQLSALVVITCLGVVFTAIYFIVRNEEVSK